MTAPTMAEVSLPSQMNPGERSHYRRPSDNGQIPAVRRRPSIHYEMSMAMDRVRSDFVGGDNQDLWNDTSGRDDTSTPTIIEHSLFRPVTHLLYAAIGQIPAIVLIGVFHLMIGIPFGVSYFPIDWGDNIVRNKVALGIRMFLFSTMVGQVVFTLKSGFSNPVGLQMVENVPFCHALARIALRQSSSEAAISTLLTLFGISSLIVGVVFMFLGKCKLGKVVYYFPTHVLMGCIGGIGVLIAKTGVEVTTQEPFSSFLTRWWLLMPVMGLEMLLRFLEAINIVNGRPRFPLLTPIYFCLITPIFYAVMWVFRFDMKKAISAGYFFPELTSSESMHGSWTDAVLHSDLFEMWKVVDFSTFSWSLLWDAGPTMVALTVFSLIHVPINIPAFALSTNVDTDMDKELVAHGYSNLLAGIFGGLQNYMAYTQSVLYHKSGGNGKVSGIAVALVTLALFFIGPFVTSFIPRCMAGTLLAHVGIDLLLEGVYDSIGKFDGLEYAGIWLITIVMTLYGMDAAMMAGVVAAVATYAVQSVHYVNPIRGSMSATTLRSSFRNRPRAAYALLANLERGRSHIRVIQLQGHLFFGNIAQMIDSMTFLMNQAMEESEVWVAILDFSLVLGIDSSAARALIKLKDILRKKFCVNLVVFVTGAEDGFPTEFDLRSELTKNEKSMPTDEEANECLSLLCATQYTGTHVSSTLDDALILAEDALLVRSRVPIRMESLVDSGADEAVIAHQYLLNLIPGQPNTQTVETLFSRFTREECRKDDIVWAQGDPGDSLKILVRGELIAVLENEAGTVETISTGNTIGEVGLVLGLPRMSTVKCISDVAVLFSLSKDDFEYFCNSDPAVARLVDVICVRYLSNRVQHVSNRIFETRCLPI